MKHAIYINGENVERVVRDIDYKILCDGMQYGLITHKKEEVVVCRPRNEQGEGYGHWVSEDKFQSKQEMQALNSQVDPLELSDEAYEGWIDKVAWKAFLGDDIDPRRQEF